MSALNEAARAARRQVIIEAIVHAISEQMHAGLLQEMQHGMDERGHFLSVEGDILLTPLADDILKEIAPLA